MAETFDLVVIGTGVAGLSVAKTCRAAAWRVAIADERPYGGTCALRGCDPKKVLIGAAEAVDAAHRLIGRGIYGGVELNWAQLQALKRSFTDPVPQAREHALQAAGITCLHGHARISGREQVEVNGESLQSAHIVFAGGARPISLGIDGEQHLLNSDDFLGLRALPSSLILVGGGYIGFEFAHLAVRGGSQVTLLHRNAQALPHFDADLVKQLIAHSRAQGIDVRLGMDVTAVEPAESGGFVAHTDSGENFAAAAVVHTAGRVPAAVDAEPAARIEHDAKGRLRLNDYLQSVSNPAVYAAGDADGSGPPLTPVASYEAAIVAANLMHGNQRKADYAGVPSVVFSIPPLAAVGLTEGEARRQGLAFRVYGQDSSDWYSARRRNQPAGFKILLEEASDRLLGAHLLGPDAAELINLFALAIRTGLPADELRDTLFAYPSAASEIGYMLPESLRAAAPPYRSVIHRH